MTPDYEQFYHQYVEELKQQHARNTKRIRAGLWINIFLPVVFLIISFLVDSSKLVFLILWIGSLFGIAFYLMYVEYTDYKMQERLAAIGAGEVDKLIGDRVEAASDQAAGRMDDIDERIDEHKQAIKNKVEAYKEGAHKKLTRGADEAREKIGEYKHGTLEKLEEGRETGKKIAQELKAELGHAGPEPGPGIIALDTNDSVKKPDTKHTAAFNENDPSKGTSSTPPEDDRNNTAGTFEAALEDAIEKEEEKHA